MISHVASLQGGRPTPTQRFAEAFRRQLRAIETGSGRGRFPRPHGLYERHPRMHYHFNPELFVQLGGVTEFTFPHDRLTLHPGELCLVPRGLPHAETVRAEVNPFENIVVSFYNDTIDVHLAHEVGRGLPRADEVHLFVTELYEDLIAYLNRIGELHARDATRHADAIRGLLLAEFSLLLTTVTEPAAHAPVTTDIVALCRWLIQHNLQDDTLSLESLAAELACSPNYLSRLFRRKMGERLVEHINRLRVRRAIEALRGTRLSVKAVSAACGFGDANYFARVFRQVTGRSPQRFRADFQRAVQPGELAPLPTEHAHRVDASVTIDGEAALRDADLPASLSA